MSAFDVEFTPAASRAFRKLSGDIRLRIRSALTKLADEVAVPGRIGGKRVRPIQGTADAFHRLCVGDYRVMYDVVHEDKVILVLGIVHRSELERWLRGR